MSDKIPVSRRKVLSGIGALGIAGATGVALTGGGAASSLSVTADNVEVSTDHGEIDRVSIQPDLDINFDGFDETVGKIRILIEARPHDVDSEYLGQWAPIFRATAWLNGTKFQESDGTEYENGPGYHGRLVARNGWFGGSDGLTLYDRDGPDYPDLSNPEAFWDGTSVGQDVPEDGFENGIYAQAGTVDRFFNETDGTTKATTIDIRYTVSFHAPNGSIASDYGIPEEDVSEQSPLVMADADDVDSPITNYPPEAIPYNVLQNNADGHPAVIVEETSFDVDVENEPAEMNTEGSSGTGIEATDDTETTSE